MSASGFLTSSRRAKHRLGLLAFIAVAAFGMLGIGACTAYGDWELVWADEFDDVGPNVDSTKWAFDTGNGSGGWGNNEREFYTSRTNNAYVGGGVLHIVARQESTNGFPYTSARLKTQGKYWKTFGRIEWRAKLPVGRGTWPALWMLGTNITSQAWPRCGEIDVMENKGYETNTVTAAIHYNTAGNPGGDVFQTGTRNFPSGDAITNWHTYAVEWYTNQILWVVDGVVRRTWNSWTSSLGPFPAPFDRPFFLLMNVAIGGQFLGDPSDAQINAGTTFPCEMQVDYVRVYDFVESIVPPATPTGLMATPGGNLVALNWNASSNATSYIVRRATVSGGPYTAIGTAPSASFSDTGVVSCATYYYVVAATNSVGVSTNSNEASATLGSYSIAVNSGGNAAAPFIADANVSGGTVAAPTGSTIDTAGVTNPAPQAVYQTERYNTMTYTFSGLTTGTSYLVRLHFAEYYFSSANARKFNVSINGSQVLTNYDIFVAAGGQNKAIVREFTITPNGSGQIVIAYTVGTADLPKASGIEVILPSPTAPTGLMAEAGDAQVALSWNAVSGATGYNLKRGTISSGPYTSVTNGLTSTIFTNTGLVNGTNYYYVVSTVKGGCESTNSTEVSATPVSPLTPFEQWQIQYFGSTNNPAAAPDADADGTGQDNQFKYVTGLDPTNPASVFVLEVINVTNQPNQVDLLFDPVVTGRTYTPYFNTDMVGGVWTQLTGYAGPVTNGDRVTITDQNATVSNKFYRIFISFP